MPLKLRPQRFHLWKFDIIFSNRKYRKYDALWCEMPKSRSFRGKSNSSRIFFLHGICSEHIKWIKNWEEFSTKLFFLVSYNLPKLKNAVKLTNFVSFNFHTFIHCCHLFKDVLCFVTVQIGFRAVCYILFDGKKFSRSSPLLNYVLCIHTLLSVLKQFSIQYEINWLTDLWRSQT